MIRDSYSFRKAAGKYLDEKTGGCWEWAEPTSAGGLPVVRVLASRDLLLKVILPHLRKTLLKFYSTASIYWQLSVELVNLRDNSDYKYGVRFTQRPISYTSTSSTSYYSVDTSWTPNISTSGWNAGSYIPPVPYKKVSTQTQDTATTFNCNISNKKTPR